MINQVVPVVTLRSLGKIAIVPQVDPARWFLSILWYLLYLDLETLSVCHHSSFHIHRSLHPLNGVQSPIADKQDYEYRIHETLGGGEQFGE